jgi:hypothetical protein
MLGRRRAITTGTPSTTTLLLPDYVDRDLHRRNRSSVLKPVCGVPILGPAHSRSIVRSDFISMVSDREVVPVPVEVEVAVPA